MIRFPVVDSALEGFRLTRERPWAVAAWGGVILLVNLVTLTVMIGLGLGPTLEALGQLSPQASWTEVGPLFEKAAGFMAGAGLLMLVSNAVLYTAVLRAVLTPADSRFAYLRLGRQELRQVGLWLAAGVLLCAYLLLLLAVQLTVQFAASGMDAQAARLVVALVAAGSFVAVLYPLLRLSLAPAMTFAERRITLIRAWPVTRGQFWGLLGCYLVAGLLALAVFLLAQIIFDALISAVSLAVGAGPSLLQSVNHPDIGSFAGFLTPATLIGAAYSSLVGALLLVLSIGPTPMIYAALAGSPSLHADGALAKPRS